MPRGACHALLASALLALLSLSPAPAAERPDFATWRAELCPDAKRFGIRRATFDAAFKDLTPDLSLPDLDRPPKAGYKARGQPEFVRRPQDYVREKSIRRLAATGRRLVGHHDAVSENVRSDGFDIFRGHIAAMSKESVRLGRARERDGSPW